MSYMKCWFVNCGCGCALRSYRWWLRWFSPGINLQGKYGLLLNPQGGLPICEAARRASCARQTCEAKRKDGTYCIQHLFLASERTKPRVRLPNIHSLETKNNIAIRNWIVPPVKRYCWLEPNSVFMDILITRNVQIGLNWTRGKRSLCTLINVLVVCATYLMHPCANLQWLQYLHNTKL